MSDVANFPGLGGHWPLEACKACGWFTLYADWPKGGHAYGLRCARCTTHNGWMMKADAPVFEERLARRVYAHLVAPAVLIKARAEMQQGALFG